MDYCAIQGVGLFWVNRWWSISRLIFDPILKVLSGFFTSSRRFLCSQKKFEVFMVIPKSKQYFNMIVSIKFDAYQQDIKDVELYRDTKHTKRAPLRHLTLHYKALANKRRKAIETLWEKSRFARIRFKFRRRRKWTSGKIWSLFKMTSSIVKRMIKMSSWIEIVSRTLSQTNLSWLFPS